MTRCRAAVTTLVIVTTLVAIAPSPAGATPTGSAARRALLLYPAWTAGNGSQAAPPDRSLAEVADAVGPQARRWFWQVSHQQFPGFDVDSAGPLAIEPPRMDVGGQCADLWQADLRDRSNAAARARGLDPAAYDVVVYYFSSFPGCPWPGLASADWAMLNGSVRIGLVVQELAHTLDLGHGLGLSCVDANGVHVTLSTKCTVIGYGDPFNASGSGDGSFSAIQQDDLGWMSGRIADASLTDATYTLAPIEQVAPATQALRVPDGTGTLWLEYRRPIGVDSTMNPMTPMVQVRRQMPEHGRKSILLDLAPDRFVWFNDGGMTAGRSFTSPNTGITITVTSLTESAATIDVRVPTRRVPNVVGQTKAAATRTLQGAEFVVRSASQLDETCEDVGLVMRQSPAGGTVQRLGTAVTIYVGVAPRTGCP